VNSCDFQQVSTAVISAMQEESMNRRWAAGYSYTGYAVTLRWVNRAGSWQICS